MLNYLDIKFIVDKIQRMVDLLGEHNYGYDISCAKNNLEDAVLDLQHCIANAKPADIVNIQDAGECHIFYPKSHE